MPEGVEPAVSVVAGCLFEVSLPDDAEDPWRWRDPGRPEVTLLGQAVRQGRRHFRFRAEAAGAVAGEVEPTGRASGRQVQPGVGEVTNREDDPDEPGVGGSAGADDVTSGQSVKEPHRRPCPRAPSR